jgi:hypothetical protein
MKKMIINTCMLNLVFEITRPNHILKIWIYEFYLR